MDLHGGEIVVQTIRHAGGWVVVPISVGSIFEVRFVLNTGYLISAIGSATASVLEALGLLESSSARTYVLRAPSLAQQSIPDLVIRVAPALHLLGIEGILGLNFLNQFTDIHFHVPSGRLRLRF